MREGVGIASSLRWVSQRFAQRALAGFFAGQWREFLIDVGTAVEHAAKAVIAAHDPVNVIVESQRGQLTDADRAVLHGRSWAPDTSVANWETAMGHVAAMLTIRGSDAVRIAHDDLSVALDVTATVALLNARNAAAHIGDVDIEHLDLHGAVFLAAVELLWPATGPGVRPVDMWGYLAPIATVDHVRVGRSVERDADVRVVLARQHPLGLGVVAAGRRSRIPIDGDVTCPACGSSAFRTTVPAVMYAAGLAGTADPDATVDLLDCVVCDLVLRGPQVDYALMRQPT